MTEHKSECHQANKQFSLGMFFIVISWFIFSLLLSPPSLPSLSPDESNDIGSLPNFSKFTNTQKKKQAFFNFLFPIIVDENLFLMQIRDQLENLDNKYKLQSLSADETEWLLQLKEDYFIESEDPRVA